MPTTSPNPALNAVTLSIIGSVVLVLLKGFSGYFGHSYALIADAIESTADIFSSVMVYLGLKFAQKPADDNHPYGHGKIEPLTTFVVVTFLLLSAGVIAYHSISNINTRHQAPAAWTLLVLVPIIAWKEMAFHLIMKKAKALNNQTLRAEAWHQRSDAITSVAAFIGVSIAVIMGRGYENADDWAALFAAAIIVYNSYHLFRPAFAELMDEHLYDDLITDVRRESHKVAGIIATEKCFVRKSGQAYFIDLHIIIDGEMTVRDGHALSHRLKDHLLTAFPDIENILIHIEPDNDPDVSWSPPQTSKTSREK